MPKTLEEVIELFTHEYHTGIHYQFLERQAVWSRMNAIRLGWKRDRTNRIKWSDARKKKIRKLFNA